MNGSPLSRSPQGPRSSLLVLAAFLCLGVMAAGCGGASARGSSGAGASSGRDERPESDQGLATWARTDPPPFPVTQFTSVASPLGGHLPADRLALIASFLRWYERDPYDPRINLWGEAPLSTRAALLAWVTESPDVHVDVNIAVSVMAERRGEDRERIGRFMTFGAMLGMAAHAIEHPELDPQDPIRQAAGIESGLRWYEAAVSRGSPRSPFLDELRGIRDQGQLPTWFAQHIRFND